MFENVKKSEKKKSNDVLFDFVNIHLNNNESMSTNINKKKRNEKDSTIWSPHKIKSGVQ
jgi:hypothetical protein